MVPFIIMMMMMMMIIIINWKGFFSVNTLLSFGSLWVKKVSLSV